MFAGLHRQVLGVTEENLRARLFLLDRHVPVETAETVDLILPQEPCDFRIGMKSENLVGLQGGFDRRSKFAARVSMKTQSTDRIEHDRQHVFQLGGAERARVVILACLEEYAAPGLDELSQRLDEERALRAVRGNLHRIYVAQDHHIVSVEQLFARRGHSRQNGHVARRLLRKVARGGKQIALRNDVLVRTQEQVLDEAILPARIPLDIQNAHHGGGDVHEEFEPIVVYHRLALERRQRHAETPLTCAQVGVGSDQNDTLTLFGQLDATFGHDTIVAGDRVQLFQHDHGVRA
ncbi:MAG: hypothetical protein CMJ89_11775 [Planctomycetes bacterium]|nr:hypothetical protein [Planctomycetota bacterium]